MNDLGAVRLVVALAAATALLGPARAQDREPPSDAAAVARVERYLKGLRTLKAEFTQAIVDETGALRDAAQGSLAIARPGRFRWEYRQPAPQLLVSDGRTVWLYDAELEQVTVRPVADSLDHTPAMLLAGQGTVSEAYRVRDEGRAEGLDFIALEPRVADADFRNLRLGFRGAELERLELLDRLGQTTRIVLSRPERNPALPDALFTFEPPAGVDVVGAPAGH
jgi:outer membrane lipoprotein carrier protein